jgi:hypothetical protein
LAEEIHRALQVSNVQMIFEEIANGKRYSPPSLMLKGNTLAEGPASRLSGACEERASWKVPIQR